MDDLTLQNQSAPHEEADQDLVTRLALDAIVSTRNTRKTMDPAELAELAESIKKHGILQPIVVRPDPVTDGQYQLIAGHRRHAASALAGRTSIPAKIVHVNDLEALELQVIENLQRVDLHPLEEAEGYEELLAGHKDEEGYGVEQLAALLGKSKAYIYARLKLCALQPVCRTAFYAGELDASTALLLARIPVPTLQEQALKEVTKQGYMGAPMPFRQAKDHVQRNYMLRLDQAKFKIQDETLVPTAGACRSCSKRTGSNPDLFGDVEHADVCTDPECFDSKRKAHAARLIAAANESGKKVITGKEAKKIKPHQHSSGYEGYVQPEANCWETGGGGKTYKRLLGKDAPESVLLEDPHTGEIVELLPAAATKQALKDKGLVVSRSTNEYSPQQRAEEAKREGLKAYRRELYQAIHEAVQQRLQSGETLFLEDMQLLAATFLDRLYSNIQPVVRKLWDWDATGEKVGIGQLGATDIAVLMVDIALASETDQPTYSSNTEPTRMREFAARYGIDADAIKKRLQAEARAKLKAKADAAKAAAEKRQAGKKSEKAALTKKGARAKTADSATPAVEENIATGGFTAGDRVMVRHVANGANGRPLPWRGQFGVIQDIHSLGALIKWDNGRRPARLDVSHLIAAEAAEAAQTAALADTAAQAPNESAPASAISDEAAATGKTVSETQGA